MSQQPSRADAYASAFLEIAQAEGELDQVQDDLFRIARAVEANELLRDTLTDEAVPVEARQGIVEELFGGRASPLATALVSFLIGAGRGRQLPTVIDRLLQQAAEERKEAVAEVRTATPLDESQRARLTEALGKATGKRVSLRVVVDPSVLGGILAQVGDTVIDGTVRHRLQQLKESL